MIKDAPRNHGHRIVEGKHTKAARWSILQSPQSFDVVANDIGLVYLRRKTPFLKTVK